MSSKIMSINQLSSCASLLMLQCFKIKIIEVCFGYSWEGMDKLSTAPNSRVQCKHFLYFSSKSVGLHEWWLARKPLKYWACISLHSCYLKYCFQSSMTNPSRCVQFLGPVSFLVPGYITWCSYIVTLARRLFILRMFLTILIFILLHSRCLDLANCWYKILCADYGERLMFLLMSLPSGYLQPSSIVVFSVISVLSTNLTKNKKYIITMHAHTAISKKVVGRKAKSSSQDRKVMLVVSNLPFASKQSLH